MHSVIIACASSPQRQIEGNVNFALSYLSMSTSDFDPQELENYVLELRKQLDETNNDRGTLLNVQRQMRTDMAKMSDDMKDAKDDAAKAKHDLNISQTNLKVSVIVRD